ncbi:membrane protein [Streptococcus sp. DD10]|uniref:Bax inhibitor-1/YccA family protein n=1 Tax=Streptococcus sp. DD10 TaxID=1777878 RepID=UPI000791E6B2|nr:Bax inhibitor-1/YccA family protein [Streptococcus sp. DD10]KXT74220.1 membrane protein [Streptococcus sp. DD10]
MNNTIIQDTAGINAFYSKVYSLVGMGIGLSALVSGLLLTVFQNVFYTIYTQMPFIYLGAVVLELVLVFVASSMSWKNSPAALPVFLVYSALNGFTLTFVVARYTQGVVLSAFVTTAAMFFALALVGRFTKKDLSGMGRALYAGLIGLIIASIVNLFLGGSLSFIISIVSVLIFSGLIAWDNQRIRYVYEQSGGQVANGWAVSLALSLYLDFINLFLSILRIFGNND